jgi:hypothetical protein
LPVIKNDADLHEAIFTRGDVMGLNKSLRIIVNHRCNVVFRHHVCDAKKYHTAGHGSREDIRACVYQIIQSEGEESVLEYVKNVLEIVPVLLPQARRAILLMLEYRGVVASAGDVVTEMLKGRIKV